ncbi:MAG: hypothetical protein ACRC2V_18345 [Xenococcaceae cyanobacterium]
MKNLNSLNKIVSYGQKILLISCTLAVGSLVWLQVFTANIHAANAAILNSNASDRVISMDNPVDKIKGKIEENFDSTKNNLKTLESQQNPGEIQQKNLKTQQNIQEGNPKLYNASSAIRGTAKDIKEDVKN